MESDRTRIQDPEAMGLDFYERHVRNRDAFRERNLAGHLVVKEEERPWQLCRQARLKYMMMPEFEDTALNNWWVFLEDIRTHSGKHRHQGGLVIFVVEGKGYSVVDGIRYDWEAGDLILLPHKPDGVEHQHFNADPGAGCKWLAFIYQPYWDLVAAEIVQMEVSPEWLAANGQGGAAS